MSDPRHPPMNRYSRSFPGIRAVFRELQKRLLQEYASSEQIIHPGDKGEEREMFLKNFLHSDYFPAKYAVPDAHGAVIADSGRISEQTDIVIYDAHNCPVLRDGNSHQYYPIESVYCTIQVKSQINKAKLISAAENIASVKRLAKSGDIKVRRGPAIITQKRSIPVGVIFAFGCASGCSLDSLASNLKEHQDSHKQEEWVNLICVLGQGLIFNTRTEDHGIKRTIDSLQLLEKHREHYRIQSVNYRDDTLLHFYLSLIGALGRMELAPPPLHNYVDLPFTTAKDNYYRLVEMTALSCPDHGFFETRVRDDVIDKLADFIGNVPKLYSPAEYVAFEHGLSDLARVNGGNIEDYFPKAYIYSEEGDNLREILRTKQYNGQYVASRLLFEVNGEFILVPHKYLCTDPSVPGSLYHIFENCPACPKGNAAKVTSGIWVIGSED